MQPHHLKLAGFGVLALGVFLIIQELRHEAPIARNHRQAFGPRTHVRDGAFSAPSSQWRATSIRRATAEGIAATAPGSSESGGNALGSLELNANTHRRQPGGPSPFATTHPLPAVRLSDTARLPAVILAQVNGGSIGPQPSTPEMAAATEAVVASFYRDLAERVAEEIPDEVAADESGAPLPDGEATAVVQPGPGLEAASSTANEQFRALFGQSAYNRHSIISALELSSQGQAGGGSGP